MGKTNRQGIPHPKYVSAKRELFLFEDFLSPEILESLNKLRRQRERKNPAAKRVVSAKRR